MSPNPPHGRPASSKLALSRRLAPLLMAEVVALMAFTTPNEGFTRWAFLDSGADLSIRSMIARGLRPTIDFGYIYGLLPLSLTDLWQNCFGATPTACRGATLVCHLAFAWGLARLASAMRVGLAGVALMMVAMPDMLLTSTVVLVHALEPALLINALACQANGRRATALSLATVCLFVKPTMGYLYGLVLLADIFASEGRKAWKSLIPAAATGSLLAILLGILHGPVPLVRTLLPGGGMAVYRAQDYGFFNAAGRQFWMIPGGGIRDYFRYEVGGWIVGAVLLMAAGLLASARITRGRGTRRDEIIATCAVLHTVFILIFFGNRFSWIYYYSILISGIAAIGGRAEMEGRGSPEDGPFLKRSTAIVIAFTLIVLIGSKVKLQMNARLWEINRPSPATYGLWASSSQRAEWLEVIDLARGSEPVALLSDCEGATVLAPGLFKPADCSYLVEGHTIPSETRRKAGVIADSSMIVCTRAPDHYGYWPEITGALDGCRLVKKSGMFWILRRERPPSLPLGPRLPSG